MVLRILRGLHELGDDVLRRGHVGIAHAEIDDVLAARARFGLEVVDDGEHVGRQTLDPIELVHRAPSRARTACCGQSRDDTEALRKVSTNRTMTRIYSTIRRAGRGQSGTATDRCVPNWLVRRGVSG